MANYACAEGQIDLKPYVMGAYTYDDNVFRLASKDQARLILGNEAMSDRMAFAEAGINANFRISRQTVLAQLGVNKTKFDRFGFLDNEGNNKKLAWNWVLGNHLGGELSISETKAMGGFNEIRNPLLNMRTTQVKRASINWDFHPSWRLHLSHTETDLTNGLETYRRLDRSDEANEGGLLFKTSEGNSIDLTAKQTDTNYPARDSFSALVFGNKHQQRELGVNVTWHATGKMIFNGRLGSVERTYAELSQRNSKDWTGQLNVTWQPTEKTSLIAGASHDSYAIDDLAATYVQSEKLTFMPIWKPTSKLGLQGNLVYENRSYQGDPGFVLGGGPQREETQKTAALTLSYDPYEKIKTQLTAQKIKRDGNVAGYVYETNSIMANVRVDF